VKSEAATDGSDDNLKVKKLVCIQEMSLAALPVLQGYLDKFLEMQDKFLEMHRTILDRIDEL
jgi:hypothetical protein